MIITDLDTDSTLSEYFNLIGQPFDFLPNTEQPIVEILDHKTKKTSDNIFLLNFDSVVKIFEQESKFSNIESLLEKNRLLIHGTNFDVLQVISHKIDNGSGFIEWLDNLAPTILVDGFVGDKMKGYLTNCHFYSLEHHFIDPKIQPGYYHILKKHKPVKNFFCHTILKGRKIGREILKQKLENKGLFDKGICRFHTNEDQREEFIQSDINDKILGIDLKSYLHQYPAIELYNQTYLEIVVETLTKLDNDNSFFITEKTLKPILMKHPFMIVGPYHHLKNLKLLGFKTFDHFIDESYDECTDFEHRITKIVNNLCDLEENYGKFYQDTREICEFNHRHFLHLQGEHKMRLLESFDKFWQNYKGKEDYDRI